MYPTIDKPTRITHNTATLIDNIFTNNLMQYSTNILLSDLSDHLPIGLFGPSLGKSKESKTFYWKRDTSDLNISALKRELELVDWNLIMPADNVNNCYDQFISKLNVLYDKCIPLKRYSTSHKDLKSPWLTKGLLKSIRHKHKLYKKFVVKGTNLCKSSYDTYRNRLTTIVRNAKKKLLPQSIG